MPDSLPPRSFLGSRDQGLGPPALVAEPEVAAARRRAMDWKSSAGMLKTVHLAVDWHHSESPPHGRSAVEWLLECARHTLL